jgi:hypothetical protein
MSKRELLIMPFILLAAVLVSGCLGEGPTSIAMKDPAIYQFMQEHPGTAIRARFYPQQEAEKLIGTIRADCANDSIQPKSFYLVNMTDQGSTAVAWIDWQNLSVQCAFKLGSGQSGCISHGNILCYGDHSFWFDSCWNKEDKNENCTYGCLYGKCRPAKEGCNAHAWEKCDSGNIYWFDSCGNMQEEKEHCDYGCVGLSCKREDIKCTDTDAGRDYFQKGITEDNASRRFEDYCGADGNLTEFYCSGGEIKEEKHACPVVCRDGACAEEVNRTVCTDSDGGFNYTGKGEVSGFEQKIGAVIEHEGDIDAMFIESTSKATLMILSDSKRVTLGGTYDYPIGRLYINSIYFFGLNNTNNYMETIMRTVKDYCLGNYTIEFYCKTTGVYGITQYKCLNTCVNGACFNETT